MSFAVKITLWLLKGERLTLAERNALSTAILGALEALPIRDIVSASDEGILINGKSLSIEKVNVLREAALASLENQAFNLIGDQVRYVATERLLNKVNVPEDLYFYRAAVWFVEQMRAHLQILAQRSPQLPGQDDY